MALDASQARNKIADAISSARATRFMGVISIHVGNKSGSEKAPLDMGVST